eukprot:1440066-Amphidinium_carterae.1
MLSGRVVGTMWSSSSMVVNALAMSCRYDEGCSGCEGSTVEGHLSPAADVELFTRYAGSLGVLVEVFHKVTNLVACGIGSCVE